MTILDLVWCSQSRGFEGSGTACLPLPLGEGRGEGIVRRSRNNPPGFSPLLKRGHQSILQRRRCCDETLNGLRAEARSHVVVVVCAPGPHRNPLPKGEGVKLY